MAVRLICDREKEIESFIPEEYWSIEGVFKGSDNNSIFSAKFYGKDGEKIDLKSEEEVNKILASIEGLNYKVKKIQVQERKRNPAPPFTTSTLQQEASRKLGFTTKKTMMLAQQLYEGLPIGEKGDAVGLITYIRTDAVSVSPLAQEEAREYIHEKYGDKFLPDKPRKFTSKKGAQEAHEAIRPTSVFRSPDVIKKYLKRDQFRLYKLIWERFLASLMETALIEQIRADISVGDYIFRASGSSVKFPGFMVLYIEGEDEEKEKEKQLPPLEEGQTLKLISLTPDQHFTQPPPRFTEASLVKTLENKGIGRPSTYSPTIDTIQSRGYVIKENKALKPTELGFIIVDILKNFFPEIIDEDFTAQLEDKLDKVESGEESRLKILNEFYIPFKNRLQVAKNEMKKIEIQDEETDEVCPHCGKNLVKKHGRYGPFLACPGFPECRYTMQPKKDTGVKCPLCNGSIVERRTRKGKLFYGCSSYPECRFVSWNKPLDKKCPKCGYYLVEKKYKGPYTGYRCANKECDFQEKKLENK